MSYLEELLPEFRKGAKIRKKEWKKERYLYFECDDIWNEDDELISFCGEDITDDCWELYQEPIDLNYCRPVRRDEVTFYEDKKDE